jgi:hypothetical protein
MNMKKAIAAVIFAAGCIAASLSIVTPSTAQLIFGNTFPFWNVTGPLTVGGPASLSGVTTVSQLTVTGTTALTGGITGVTNSAVAAAGSVGELLSAIQGLSGTVLTNGSAYAPGPCVTLTAGDWDVQGNAIFSMTSAAYSTVVAGINTSALSGVRPGLGQFTQWTTVSAINATGGSVVSLETPIVTAQLNVPTSYCTTANVSFSSGSVALYGQIRARRMH